jgi:2-methylisocitrate lyase-like PEP mutase family enzyme
MKFFPTTSSCRSWLPRTCHIKCGIGFRCCRRDGGLTRNEALAHARLLVDATNLPVSADLEKGFGDGPEVVAETIRLAAEAGLVGCAIEDATGNQDRPLYDLPLAVERIAAAAQAATRSRVSFCPHCSSPQFPLR